MDPSLLGSTSSPRIVITEQPKPNGLRFRYATEGDKAGSIHGASTTPQNQTYPTVELRNCMGQTSTVVVSCVTATDPIHAHPHRLVGPSCRDGACIISLTPSRNRAPVTVTKVGIQCCKHNDIANSLKNRSRYVNYLSCLDSNFQPPDGVQYEMNRIRLCFQLFVGEPPVFVDGVISNVVTDKKNAGELTVTRLSRSSGSATGGDEIIMLCTGIKKADDIDVVFQSYDKTWSEHAEFGPTDVHKLYAIAFRTPACPMAANVFGSTTVHVYLHCPSSGQQSEPKEFQYFPVKEDKYNIGGKRKRLQDCISTQQPPSFYHHIDAPVNQNQGIFMQYRPAQPYQPNSLPPLVAKRETQPIQSFIVGSGNTAVLPSSVSEPSLLRGQRLPVDHVGVSSTSTQAQQVDWSRSLVYSGNGTAPAPMIQASFQPAEHMNNSATRQLPHVPVSGIPMALQLSNVGDSCLLLPGHFQQPGSYYSNAGENFHDRQSSDFVRNHAVLNPAELLASTAAPTRGDVTFDIDATQRPNSQEMRDFFESAPPDVQDILDEFIKGLFH